MFRLSGEKYGKTIACFRTPLSVMTAMIPEPTRSFTDLRKSVIRWIWEILFGWMPQCGISKRHDKARFYQDNFIEHIEFDYLEIQVIEED